LNEIGRSGKGSSNHGDRRKENSFADFGRQALALFLMRNLGRGFLGQSKVFGV